MTSIKLYPQSLLGRTVFVIAIVVIIIQIFAISLFRAYNQGPLFDEMAALLTGQLRVISSALETLPEEERIDFLDILEEKQGIRVVPETGIELPANRPQSSQLQDFANYLKNELGNNTEFFIDQATGKTLWVKLTVIDKKYWISIPRKQIERKVPWLWFGWMIFSALLVSVGAYLLVRRVNMPLRNLTNASHDLGSGKVPARLEETGVVEIREVSRAFNKMVEDIHNYESERSLLLAGVSHDLRTPLSRLRLSIDIAENLEQDLYKGMVDDIDQIDAIIQQFLNFSRTTQDEPIELINLNDIVSSTVDRYRQLGKEIHGETISIPAMPLRPLAIQRLLDNLISNAIRYSEEVIVRTTISGSLITLSVLDRGPGIPLDQVEHVKRPFTRLNIARTNAGYAGLGLAIVDRIATLHGAKFFLSPRDGGGLDAHISFPNTQRY